ncbi:hypothetical protein BOTNAR_0030g00060 [Botryotinia narcissicola]|uniref:Uncharacterized protein n=1 Tax=Botryotinia narcissicola TaxID=278944 RepID=A0A4Z1J4I2_9HELO|nr:hypothetical protein BOTNAR_0030g00060 [Botryotinia narcissicola]
MIPHPRGQDTQHFDVGGSDTCSSTFDTNSKDRASGGARQYTWFMEQARVAPSPGTIIFMASH